ncbi:MAG TPA: aldehyde dehydrogenase family protein [Pseudobdellovibrionaceae bacterium]|nr:aldehyde dehydrogenase family protein [Pseudobdellovibrionaceae bacterium]
MSQQTPRPWPQEFKSAEILFDSHRPESFEFRSPNDGASYGRFSLHTEGEASAMMLAVSQASALHAAPVSLALRMAAEALDTERESWARLIAFEGGKPIRQARIEAERAAITLRWSASEAERVAGQVLPLQSLSQPQADGKYIAAPWAFTQLEPAGPVLAILAFNHPLNLLAHAVGPALAAGCPIVVKPALETAHTAHRFCQLISQVWREVSAAKCPVDLALWSNSLTQSKLRDPMWGTVQFVGSSRVGWAMAREVHPGVRVLLEHGGAAPAIVAEDADLQAAAQTLCRHGYFHSGQVCVSLQRVYVHRHVADEFLRLFTQEVRALRFGDAMDEATDCGPLIRMQDADRVEAWIREAEGSGAKVLVGGQRRGERFIEPTLIYGIPEASHLAKEEIFGPVVGVQVVEDLEEALRLANSTPWIFQASVWSKSLAQSRDLANRLRATAVMINEGPSFRVDWMPFRGEGASGRGVGGVPGHVRELMREKLLVVR